MSDRRKKSQTPLTAAPGGQQPPALDQAKLEARVQRAVQVTDVNIDGKTGRVYLAGRGQLAIEETVMAMTFAEAMQFAGSLMLTLSQVSMTLAVGEQAPVVDPSVNGQPGARG